MSGFKLVEDIMQTCDEGAGTNEDQICHMSIIHRNWERWARVKGATHRQKPVKNSVRLKSGQDTHRALFLRGLHTARPVVAYTAS